MDSIITISESVEEIVLDENQTVSYLEYEEDHKIILVADDKPSDQVVTNCQEIREVIESIEQGPQGSPGGVGFWVTVSTPIGGHRVISIDENRQVIYADYRNWQYTKRIIGISVTASAAGGQIKVIKEGEIEEPSWMWDMTRLIFLGENGILTQELPEDGAVVVLGFPIDSNKMIVDIGEPIILKN
jgi:hypothetical protein